VLPPPVPGPAGDRGAVERLRRVRRAGVTTFDVAASPQPLQAERLLRAAFPDPDPDLVIIVGRQLEHLVRQEEGGRPALTSTGGVAERVRLSLEDSDRRLAPNHLGIVEWTDPHLPPGLDWAKATRGLGGEASTWLCRRWTQGEVPDPVLTGELSTPPLRSGPLSLLDAQLVAPIEIRMRSAPIAFLARDPFAGGRLDGTRAAGSAIERGPGAGPVRLRDLEAEFAPVLRLAHLTAERRRTMAQAAILYATHWPWVVSVLAPLPTSDRLEEVLGSFQAPPLTEEELRRVDLTNGPRRTPDR
jgi:aryl-alcohol dehydrogenase-like predicted oxidoreductase